MESSTDNPTSRDLADLIGSTKSSGHKRWLWTIVALAAAAGIVWFVFLRHSGSSPSEESLFVTQPVRRGDVELTITATGNLEPTNEVTIGSELSGTTAEVFVDANDLVTVGQKLARIEVRRLSQEINSSKAAVHAAEATVKQVEATLGENRATLKRQEELHKLSSGRMPSEADMITAQAAVTRSEADLGVALATVEQARAELEANEEEEAKSILKSPINGVVLSRALEPGQTVAASFQAPELFVVAEDLKKMKLEVAVAEADIGRVEEGQSASFTVDAWPNREYAATVKKVSYGSEITDNVVTYQTELEVTNEDLSLRPGMTATADIRVARHTGVLLVPDAALRFDPAKNGAAPSAAQKKSFLESLIPRPPRRSSRPAQGDQNGAPANGEFPGNKSLANQPKIWTLRNGVPFPIPVEVGLSEGGYTEVTASDLTENMPVIIRSQAARS